VRASRIHEFVEDKTVGFAEVVRPGLIHHVLRWRNFPIAAHEERHDDDTSRHKGGSMIYAYSSALKTMVERTVTQAHLSDPVSVEPAELERRIHGALNELSQTRPRIVEFAPQIALTRALHRDHTNSIAHQQP
jgi:hypothetical protein